jgi:hypothetical protein
VRRLTLRKLQERPTDELEWRVNIDDQRELVAEIAAPVEQLKLSPATDARQAWNQLPQRIAALI